MSWGDSFSLGALMNTRGLAELIVLNLATDLGILPPRITPQGCDGPLWGVEPAETRVR